ncbi:MAG: hypothetical protein IV097_15910 [Burkholderiaceae bacterium]|nr:hypothetical protein [Burkholderiaceae bacterium]
MEHIAPLIQTILWVCLIGGIVWRFNKPIHGLLTAIQKRVESGSNVKAGPFELNEQVRPQAIDQQVQRTEREVSELVQAQSENSVHPIASRSEVKSRFLEAEDLALRAIQVHYGKPVSRQVTFGPDVGADGAFTANGELNIVEVKYVVRDKNASESVRRTLRTFEGLFVKYGWKRARVVLAVVVELPSDLDGTKHDLEAVATDFFFPIAVHCFSLQELRSRFGLTNG